MSEETAGDEKILICSAWPYASGTPHLGNIQTSLLSGGVFRRYFELKGHDTLHVSGSDAHGTRIEYEAEKEGVTPEELARKTHEEIVEILDQFNVAIDNYTITTNPTHKEFVRDIYEKMENNGFIITDEEERAYCRSCEKFLADRFIEGTCPRCGSDGAHGNQCDACGSLLEPEELTDPVCAICGSEDIVFKSTKHWYLDLKKLKPELEDYVSENFEKWRDNVKQFTRNMLDEDMEPKAITRDIKWGIEAPFRGAEEKVIYVWAEAALGYVSATIEYFKNGERPEAWEDYWKEDDVLQIYTHAKDNIPFHTLLFPGQLIASGEGYHLPDQISASEYLNWIGGKSFSKSKGVGIYADEAIELMDPVYWRFYLLYARPEKRDIDFSWEELDKAVNKIFIDNVSNFVNRVCSFAHSKFDGEVPSGEPDEDILEKLTETKKEVEELFRQGSLSEPLEKICELANYGNSYFQKNKPWEDEDPQVVRSALRLVKGVAVMIEPFVPSFSEGVYKILKLDSVDWETSVEEVSGKIAESEALLEKVNIEELKEKYEMKKNEEPQEVEKMSKDEISFDQFKKMDIRVGNIAKAELVEGADRLYRLGIDVGSENLTTISGLKKDYKLEELEGKTVVALTNLESTKIHGQKSECMLLAAVGDEVSLLEPDKDLPPGTKVE